MGVCNCSMFCCTLLYVHSSIAIILMRKMLNLSSWCLVMVERLFLAVPRGCLRFLIVVFPDHTHLLFLLNNNLLFVSQLYENKSLVLCAHDLIFFTTGLQTVNYLELNFFFIMAFVA